MNCPICDHEIEAKTVFTCKRCWWLIPANERTALANMQRLEQPTAAKLEKCVRIVKRKHPEFTIS